MTNQPDPQQESMVDAIVIGRNEGARLMACLASLQGQVRQIIYVDSGSQDGSVQVAQDIGATVIRLDMVQPFTAARARNAGLAEVTDAEFVQFVDGDCEVRNGWVAVGLGCLRAQPNVAVVCGRRREKYPGASVYNRLCDLEWNTPVGAAMACGGDALMRVAPVTQIGGYRETLIAGEEPELCLRLRQSGWKIWRLDAEMTLHDAQLLQFSQWFKRSRRAGHAYAEGAYLHGRPPERHWVKETHRALVWGLGLPIMAVLLPFGLWLLAIYPLQVLRLGLRYRGQGPAPWARAFFAMLGKFPEAVGVVEFHWNRLRGRRTGLLEYK
ncbi:MAG: glycosyltransferase involved in cell wall biosynthesis [Paracoccaceae bacterium]